MPVVEPEREAHELRVQRVSHVELDPERLPPRDQPAADERQRFCEAEPRDQPDVQPECAAIVWPDGLVDDTARQGGDGDGEAL